MGDKPVMSVKDVAGQGDKKVYYMLARFHRNHLLGVRYWCA